MIKQRAIFYCRECNNTILHRRRLIDSKYYTYTCVSCKNVITDPEKYYFDI